MVMFNTKIILNTNKQRSTKHLNSHPLSSSNLVTILSIEHLAHTSQHYTFSSKAISYSSCSLEKQLNALLMVSSQCISLNHVLFTSKAYTKQALTGLTTCRTLFNLKLCNKQKTLGICIRTLLKCVEVPFPIFTLPLRVPPMPLRFWALILSE